jgi:hypothetical protein
VVLGGDRDVDDLVREEHVPRLMARCGPVLPLKTEEVEGSIPLQPAGLDKELTDSSWVLVRYYLEMGNKKSYS